MYTHTVQPFGKFEKHIFQNAHGDAFEMTPQYGACLLDLRFGGVSILDGYRTPEDLIENKWAKNVILVPFPNRLRDGQYSFLGKTYQFPIKASAGNNAIHGFCRDVPMHVQAIETTTQSAHITCIWEHDGSNPAYPFKFLLTIQLTLYRDAKGAGFEMHMAAQNLDKHVIPMGMGWHPYFSLTENIADTALQMPACQLIDVDERMLPTGRKTDYTAFSQRTKIKDTTLDHGFLITEPAQDIAEISLQSESAELIYWQEIGAGKYPFVQVFTPPHRQSIAIEPMTCGADAFNNQEGLSHLEPNAVLAGRFGVRMTTS
jgi:aldose 1-epimerase